VPAPRRESKQDVGGLFRRKRPARPRTRRIGSEEVLMDGDTPPDLKRA